MVHRMAADPLVGGLLALHDLHPVPVAQRLRARAGRGPAQAGRHGSRRRAARGSTTTARCRSQVAGGGCGDETVKDVVTDEVDGELAPEVGRASSFDDRAGRADAAADRVRPPERGVVTAIDRSACAGSWSTPATAAPAPERCEMCATPVPPEHPHLVQVAERRMLCACGPCGFLFDNPGAGGGGYRAGARPLPGRPRVPADRRRSGTPCRSRSGMAFFLHNSARGAIVACYPSPAGATESELTLDAWAAGVGASRAGRRAATRTSRRCWCAGSRRHVPARADRRLLPAGRAGPAALARLRRRQRGLGGDRRLLRPTLAATPAPGRWTRAGA